MNIALKDFEPCRHPGCLQHTSHPCEGCGRVAGRAVVVKALSEQALNNATVHAILESGGSEVDCINQLVKAQATFMEKLVELNSICPFKMVVDEQVHIWRCPDAMVPLRRTFIGEMK